MEKFGSGILDEHPGSATLVTRYDLRFDISFQYQGQTKAFYAFKAF